MKLAIAFLSLVTCAVIIYYPIDRDRDEGIVFAPRTESNNEVDPRKYKRNDPVSGVYDIDRPVFVGPSVEEMQARLDRMRQTAMEEKELRLK